MDIKLHKTKRIYITASNHGDGLCLIFSDEKDNQYKLHMSINTMLMTGGMMHEVAYRWQRKLVARDN